MYFVFRSVGWLVARSRNQRRPVVVRDVTGLMSIPPAAASPRPSTNVVLFAEDREVLVGATWASAAVGTANETATTAKNALGRTLRAVCTRNDHPTCGDVQSGPETGPGRGCSMSMNHMAPTSRRSLRDHARGFRRLLLERVLVRVEHPPLHLFQLRLHPVVPLGERLMLPNGDYRSDRRCRRGHDDGE